ncbi:MAG: choice-of-anchor J domain-containing protein [Candidatus Thermoplasmatota archaeon]
MNQHILKKGVILTIIVLFLVSGILPIITGNQMNNDGVLSGNISNGLNQQLTYKKESNAVTDEKNLRDTDHVLNSDSKVILETSFEEEWKSDTEGDYLTPPGWDVDGISVGHQKNLPPLTHYWSHMTTKGTTLPLIRSGNASACVWWSDGNGEPEEVGKDQDEWLITPKLNFSSYTQINLTFWSQYYWAAGANNSNYVKISTDNGDTWNTVTDLVNDPRWKIGGEQEGWQNWNNYEKPITIDLSEYIMESSVRIAWNFYYPKDAAGGIWTIDDVSITGKKDTSKPEVNIEEPKPSVIYLNDEPLISIPNFDFNPIILGEINVTAVCIDNLGIKEVNFYLNNNSQEKLNTEPYVWRWNKTVFGQWTIRVKATDFAGNQASDKIKAWKLF